MTRWIQSAAFCFALLLLMASLLRAAEEPVPDYATQVAPIFKKYCAGCHNDAAPEGDFSLDSYVSLQKGTSEGPAVLPGDAESSRLIRVLTGAAEPLMPPEEEPRPTEDEIALLKAWIAGGAKGPDGEQPDRLTLIVPEIASHATTRPVTAMELAPDGQLLAVARYEKVELHAVEPMQSGGKLEMPKPQRVLEKFPGKVTSVHFTADGTRLITASGVAGLGGVAAIWNVQDESLVRQFKGHHDILYDAELSPDGGTLATCGYDKAIQLWDADSGELLRTLEGHNGAVYDVAFSPDSQFLVSASADDTCKVWRVGDGARMDTLAQPLEEAYCCTFSPDGKFIVAGGADNNLRVWKFVSHDKPRINPMVLARFAHEGPIVRLAYTPDGKILVSVAEDRTIKAWDAASFAELRLWENEPDVAMALTVAGDSFFVGRMDGSLARFEVPEGRDRKPSVPSPGQQQAEQPMPEMSELAKAAEQEPNQAREQANEVNVPVEVSGVIAGKVGEAEDEPDYDLFRFSAEAGQQWVVEVKAADASPLDSLVEVLDADGQRIERVLLQAVRDSYFTFRGKDDSTVDDFRVFNWEEMQLDQYLYANGEVVKLWLYPRGPDSGFMVYPGQGKRWGYFDTTPLAHALGEPCYIVEPHAPGTELIANGLPVFPLYYQNDDDARRELGVNSRLYFTAPADGQYLVKVKDVRGFEGHDYKYTLTIRPRRPDFRVTVHNTNPTVAAGSAKEFKVTAQRIDGFEGPIRVDIDGVPPGFTVSSPLVIEAGQIEAHGVIAADADAPKPTEETAKSSKVTAHATIWDRPVTHDAGSLGDVKLGDPPKLRVAIVPTEGGAQPVSGSSDGPLEFEMRPGETIMLKVQVQRNDYDGLVGFGKEGAGRNLPFGVYVGNLGLNGLLLLEDQNERTFFVTADPVAQPQSRLFHLNTSAEGGQASRPVLLHIRP